MENKEVLEIVKQIHSEFDHSVEVLKSYSNITEKEAESIVVPDIDSEKAEKLASVGFTESSIVKQYESTKANVSSIINIISTRLRQGEIRVSSLLVRFLIPCPLEGTTGVFLRDSK